MGAGTYAASCRACMAWINSAWAQSLLYTMYSSVSSVSSLSTAGSILQLNQCLSIAGCFKARHYDVLALRCPGQVLAPVLPRLWIRARANRKAFLIKWKASTVAATNCCLGLGNLGVWSCRRESISVKSGTSFSSPAHTWYPTHANKTVSNKFKQHVAKKMI